MIINIGAVLVSMSQFCPKITILPQHCHDICLLPGYGSCPLWQLSSMAVVRMAIVRMAVVRTRENEAYEPSQRAI